MDTDGLWETYHHIAKLAELEADEAGNIWLQQTWGIPVEYRAHAERTGVTDEQWFSMRVAMLAGEARVQEHLCGTAMCFAGWYCHQKGIPMDGWGNAKVGETWMPVASAAEITGNFSPIPCDSPHYVDENLFGGGNSLHKIGEILVRITGEDRRGGNQ